jgi:hypothetical protein
LLYDPSLPSKSRSIEFALEKLHAKETPWGAIDALYNAINNWKRQYGADIQESMKQLQKSLTPIAGLSSRGDLLVSAFGENTPKILECARTSEVLKVAAQARAEKEELDILDIVGLGEDIEKFLSIISSVLSTLKAELISKEETIERLLPTKEFLWEKNITLGERLERVTELIANPSNYKINLVLKNMYIDLVCVDEGVQTLAQYSDRSEFLLNYPLAEAAIEDALKHKDRLVAGDLPFEPRFAAEYLRLYYTERYGEYAFDKETLVLTKPKSFGNA